MAEIKPFKGIRYNTKKIKNLEDVVTPPYDVIDEQAQEKYYNRHPYNIIRLELGKTSPTDTPENNRYTRAKEFYDRWLEEDILIRDKEPSIYFYEQGFSCGGRQYKRRGFFCAVKLEEYSKNIILPHEETLPKAKEDRLNLMRQCRANFSPIFGLYIDKEKNEEEIFQKLNTIQPDIEFIDENGQSHKIWAISDSGITQKFQSLLKDKQIFIADGHHRYETALQFSREMNTENAGYVMMTLVNIYDSGLVIFPTHRLLKNLKEFETDKFLNSLKKHYETESILFDELDNENTLPAAAEKIRKALAANSDQFHRFGIYLGGKYVHFINIHKSNEQPADPSKSQAWNSLDVTVLQKMILEKLLGIGEKERKEGNFLKYVRDEVEAILDVQRGICQAALLVNPTKIDEVIAVAKSGEKMPQKSTYFYPKLITGLVINSLV
ncbi:MAG TPA: DUF1015 domain-containing protein [Peptococcaceae bacterium]|nr:MAG: Uncharacterized conserved protein UCP033563 [Clostridia bacterium 41_269]HBT20009.1 DUF1015 domain-containing protein [Peptococcaceae bacterium]